MEIIEVPVAPAMAVAAVPAKLKLGAALTVSAIVVFAVRLPPLPLTISV